MNILNLYDVIEKVYAWEIDDDNYITFLDEDYNELVRIYYDEIVTYAFSKLEQEKKKEKQHIRRIYGKNNQSSSVWTN